MSSAGMTSGSPQGSSTSARRRPQNPPSRASNGGPPSRASSPAPGSSSQRDSASASGIDTVVTRLLVSTKVLLEGLTQWSIGNCTDEKISDMYVKLGNDLNAACAAFAREKISMSDLLNVPTELRTCLEACLSEEEASPAVLDQHMPAIKAIVVRLLQGLKTRQNQYRESLARRRDADVPPVPPVTSPTVVSNPARVASPPPGSTTSREQTHRKKSSLANSTSSVSSEGPHETPQERSSFGNSVSSRTARSATSNTLSDSFASSTRPSSPSQASIPRSKSTGQMPATSPTSHQPSLPTLNFEPAPLPKPSTSAVSVSKDMDSRNIKNPSPQPQSQNSTDKSFETLRNQDNLVRRASKRFSRYTLDKMTGSPAKEDLTAGSASPTPAHRRSFRPPMPVIPPSPGDRNLHTKDLAGSPSSSQANSPREPWDSHVNDLDARPNNAAEAAQRPSGPWNQRVANLEDSQTLSASAGNGRSPFATLTERSETSSTKPLDHNQNETTQEALSKEAPYQQPEPPEFAATQVFLQLGRETKKATIDADQMPPTVASLRVMFMDRFSYNSGQEDFPQIYIRDPKLGVEYELEDMSEIKDGVLLSLNIERTLPLIPFLP